MAGKAKPLPSPSRRPSLADIAKLAGVSLMTVSYALRNNPKISPATRKNVQRAAKKLHYTPHPEVSRLMHLLRSQKLPAFQSTLGFLTATHGPKSAAHPYTAAVIAGAKKRAEALGYAVDLLAIDRESVGSKRLSTILKNRGIRGLLVPPLEMMEDCSQLLDWSQFSAVAATYSAQNLIINRVVPHHQSNIILAITQLRAAGYRRLGLVLTEDLSRRVNFAYEAAFALRQQLGELPALPGLKIDTSNPSQSVAAVSEWARIHRPDIVLTLQNGLPFVRTGLSKPSSVEIILLDHDGLSPFAGINQHPTIIGETAVDLLAGQVQRGEVGFQTHPRVTMVEGTWTAGVRA